MTFLQVQQDIDYASGIRTAIDVVTEANQGDVILHWQQLDELRKLIRTAMHIANGQYIFGQTE